MMVSTVRRWPCAPSAAGAPTSWASRTKPGLSPTPLPAPPRGGRAARPRDRPGPGGGGPGGAGAGRARDARHDLSLRLDGEQSPENRDAAHETDGAVDGIDDQPGACRPGIIALLFSEHAEARMTLPRERAGHLLDGLVHVGDGAVVGLLLDPEAGRPEAAQRKLVGPVGDLVEQREPAIGPHAGAGRPRPAAPASYRAPAARAAPHRAAGAPVPAGR